MSRLETIHKNKNSRMVHERTKEEKVPTGRGKLFPILGVLLLVGFVYLIIFSGVFRIKTVEVLGYSNPDLIQEIVAANTGSGLTANNILFIDKSDLAEVIKGDSGVRSVKIKRLLPDKIKIEVDESNGSIVWNAAGESFVIDDRGYVIEKYNNKDLPQVYDNANISISLGERVASPTFIKFIIDVSDNFEPVTGVKPDRIIIFDILSDVHIKSRAGWTVYLDATRDPVSQLENLTKVLREAKEEGHTKLQYIDMRLDNKVYYK